MSLLERELQNLKDEVRSLRSRQRKLESRTGESTEPESKRRGTGDQIAQFSPSQQDQVSRQAQLSESQPSDDNKFNGLTVSDLKRACQLSMTKNVKTLVKVLAPRMFTEEQLLSYSISGKRSCMSGEMARPPLDQRYIDTMQAILHDCCDDFSRLCGKVPKFPEGLASESEKSVVFESSQFMKYGLYFFLLFFFVNV